MSKPIPNHLMPEFRAFMDSMNDDTLPDSAWQAFMEEQAAEFMRVNAVRGDRNAAFQQWMAPD